VAPLLGKFVTLMIGQPCTPPLNQVLPVILLYVGSAIATKPAITKTTAAITPAMMRPIRDFLAACGRPGE
jgi:hypothetical protein